jgi:hypothetical protein
MPLALHRKSGAAEIQEETSLLQAVERNAMRSSMLT